MLTNVLYLAEIEPLAFEQCHAQWTMQTLFIQDVVSLAIFDVAYF